MATWYLYRNITFYLQFEEDSEPWNFEKFSRQSYLLLEFLPEIIFPFAGDVSTAGLNQRSEMIRFFATHKHSGNF